MGLDGIKNEYKNYKHFFKVIYYQEFWELFSNQGFLMSNACIFTEVRRRRLTRKLYVDVAQSYN